ncbi:glycosyltransferase [Bordetella muralis]|uniref:glycosyltransferase n=1 Tax=Bordetella muralis TaxID=1649130 RepID=UPI0039EF6404
MKILYTNFHRADGGGHTTYILSLVNALKDSHEIVVAAPPTSRLYKTVSSSPDVVAVTQDFRGGLLRTLREARRFRDFLRKEKFDIVHVNGSADHRLCMLAVKGLGVSRPAIVYTQHNDRDANGLGTLIRARLGTSRVICVCEHSRRKLERSPYARCGLAIVYNGVDVDRFSPEPHLEVSRYRARWIPPNYTNRLVVGSNAGTAAYKRWLDMVEGVALLPEHLRNQILILIAGTTPSEEQLAKVEQLGMTDHVIFAGLLDDVRPFIAALDIGFVLSSEIETISFACREMMAMGIPVIVSDAGGLAENIDPQRDGWIVPAQKPTAVAGVIENVLKDRAVLAPMRQAAREKAVSEFSLDSFVAGTQAVYLDSVGHSQLTIGPTIVASAAVATVWIHDGSNLLL